MFVQTQKSLLSFLYISCKVVDHCETVFKFKKFFLVVLWTNLVLQKVNQSRILVQNVHIKNVQPFKIAWLEKVLQI